MTLIPEGTVVFGGPDLDGVDRDDRLAPLPKMPHWNNPVPEEYVHPQKDVGVNYLHDGKYYCRGCDAMVAGRESGCLVCEATFSPISRPMMQSHSCDLCLTKWAGDSDICPTCAGKGATPNQVKDEPAKRYDLGKTEFHHFATYVDEGFCQEIGKVLAYGAIKYGRHNWQKGMSWSRCFNSSRRHLWAWWRGEKYDAESGCHHLALLFCSIMFLFVYERDGLGTDDR